MPLACGAVQRLETKLDGPILIDPVVHGDPRGFFVESYRKNVYAELGIPDDFVQHNHSRSRRGVVRGMHFQRGMAKLVSCVHGAILDVLVDLRKGSPSFGRWEAFELDDENLRQVYCPDGFGHGFCVTSESADVVYKCSTYYDPSLEGGIKYDDPDVGIAWPADLDLQPSERDANAPLLREIEAELPFSY
jgi:dTDP-4-dehydrorhamnose 3,5-epimerase